MCKRHDQRASLLDRRRQKWRWSIALGNWLTLSIFSWMKGKPSLMSRLKNTRRKRKKEKKNNTRKRGTSIYVCVSGTRRREKEKQRRRAVTLTPCNREKPVEQHGIKPRLEEWLSAGAWLKTGVQYRNNRWHLVCVCCSSREGEKKKFSFRGFTVRQRFSAVCLETRRRLLEYYFRSVWKATGRELPGQMERENE